MELNVVAIDVTFYSAEKITDRLNSILKEIQNKNGNSIKDIKYFRSDGGYIINIVVEYFKV